MDRSATAAAAEVLAGLLAVPAIYGRVVNATLVHAMRRLAACLVRITGFLLCLPIKISRRRACP